MHIPVYVCCVSSECATQKGAFREKNPARHMSKVAHASHTGKEHFENLRNEEKSFFRNLPSIEAMNCQLASQ
jgi:hypothetical protein